MSVFGGIALFAAGVVVGSGAVVAHQREVKRASDQLRRENEHLKASAWTDRLEFEAYKAYGDGYYDGSGAALESSIRPSAVWPQRPDSESQRDSDLRSSMTDVERFADFLKRRNVDYRLPRGGEQVERAQRGQRRP